MKPIRLSAAVALIVAAACLAFRPALAADAVFPPGVRVGLTPLVGLVPAKTFAGFETEDHGVKVLVTELPAAAYGEVANAFKSNPGGHGGHQARDHRDAGRHRLLHHGKRQGRRHQCAALFDDPAGRHLLRLHRRAGARERQQDLHRRCGAADVCLRRDPQGSPGRRAARAVAVQDHRPRRFQECAHAGAGRRHHARRCRRRPSSSNSALTW